jgi:hypothetical protein
MELPHMHSTWGSLLLSYLREMRRTMPSPSKPEPRIARDIGSGVSSVGLMTGQSGPTQMPVPLRATSNCFNSLKLSPANARMVMLLILSLSMDEMPMSPKSHQQDQ